MTGLSPASIPLDAQPGSTTYRKHDPSLILENSQTAVRFEIIETACVTGLWLSFGNPSGRATKPLDFVLHVS